MARTGIRVPVNRDLYYIDLTPSETEKVLERYIPSSNKRARKQPLIYDWGEKDHLD